MKATATITGVVLLLVAAPVAAQDRHGVIAFGNTGESDGVAYGFAWNFPAEDAAHAAAMNACMSGGGTDCIEVAWFQNICGALAMDQHGIAQGKPGMTQEQAEARALQGCESAAGAGCNIVGSVCTTPDGDPGTYSGRESVLPMQVAQATGTEPADESPAREEPAPLQDAQAAVTSPADELLAREERVLIQHALNALGFDAGPADGVFGPRTLAAIYYWQRASGHETTGQLTREQAAALVAQAASLAAVEESPDQEDQSPPILDADTVTEGQREAAGNVLHFGPETGPKCAEEQFTEKGGCWVALTNRPGCHYFSPDYKQNPATANTWSGACTDGGAGLVAVGQGTLEGEFDLGKGIGTGTMQLGFLDGHWTLRFSEGGVAEGPFVDGQRNGHWTLRFSDGGVAEGPFVDGQMHGHWVERFSTNVNEGSWVEGQRHGQWVTRFSDGQVVEDSYVNGEVVSREWKE